MLPYPCASYCSLPGQAVGLSPQCAANGETLSSVSPSAYTTACSKDICASRESATFD